MATLCNEPTIGSWRASARRGSFNLRKAILKMQQPKKAARRRRKLFVAHKTWEERRQRFVEIERLQHIVAEHFGLPVETMKGYRGKQDIAEKRQVAMYLAREIVQASFADIGQCFGGKDHTTVIHAHEVIGANQMLADDVAQLRERLCA